MPYSLVSVILGLLGLLSAYLVYLKVKSSSEGEGRVKEIGDEIHLGAMVFMSAEYKRLAIFCLVCIFALYFSLGWQTAISFSNWSFVFRYSRFYRYVFSNKSKCQNCRCC